MSERVTMPKEDWIGALDAARAKSGVTKKLLSGELAGVIRGIQTGITPSGTRKITENGTYDVKNYASAQVDVPETEPVIRPLSVTTNGTYAIPENADGYGPVTVNVPTEGDGITPSGVLDITRNGDYDVTQYAGVSVDVPETGITPAGTLDITQNGTYNVTEYAAVEVDVPAEGGGSGNAALHTAPSTRKCVRNASAKVHIYNGSCTDYFVHLDLFECIANYITIDLPPLSRFRDGKSPHNRMRT